MKLFLICLSFTVSAFASSRPSKVLGLPTPLNAAELDGTLWELMTQINRNTKDTFYWVPVEVVNPESQFSRGNRTEMNIVVGESDCLKGSLKVYEINPTSCPLKEEGKRATFGVIIWEKLQDNNYVKIETTKIQGDEPVEEKRLPGVIYGDKNH